MGELRFSGHESFQCRNLWLKKGYDYSKSGKDFNDNLAVIDLGVGKNMVTSIRFWMNAFGLFEDDNNVPNALGDYLLGENGRDPYLEDLGSIWLLHYKLVKESVSSIYHLVFNRFRKERIEFKKEHLKSFLLNKCEELDESHSPNTIDSDIKVFIKNYVRPESNESKGNIEDLYSSLLIELDLVKEFKTQGAKKAGWYKIESSDRQNLPIEIFFFSILDNKSYGSSISLHKLLNGDDSPGNVFVLHPDALVSKVEQLTQKYDGVVYKEDAGIRELQISEQYQKEDILDQYYGRN